MATWQIWLLLIALVLACVRLGWDLRGWLEPPARPPAENSPRSRRRGDPQPGERGIG